MVPVTRRRTCVRRARAAGPAKVPRMRCASRPARVLRTVVPATSAMRDAACSSAKAIVTAEPESATDTPGFARPRNRARTHCPPAIATRNAGPNSARLADASPTAPSADRDAWMARCVRRARKTVTGARACRVARETKTAETGTSVLGRPLGSSRCGSAPRRMAWEIYRVEAVAKGDARRHFLLE